MVEWDYYKLVYFIQFLIVLANAADVGQQNTEMASCMQKMSE